MKKNMYYLLYNMLMETLDSDDIIKGLSKSLDFIKNIYNASDIFLYKKDDDYIEYVLKSNSLIPLCILNNIKDKVVNSKYYNMNIKIGDISNVLYIPINIKTDNYVISILNTNNKIDDKLLDLVLTTFKAILSKVDDYKYIKDNINKDALTGLMNRFSYEEMAKYLDLKSVNYIYAIFDLFRLKYINDNYSHDLGDIYIKETSRILNKYFGIDSLENKVIKNKDIGSLIYRIGGDEFILITDVDDIELVNIKAKLAALEISNLSLNNDKPILGLNYGITSNEDFVKIKDVYRKADKLLIKDKNKMYKLLGIERRI